MNFSLLCLKTAFVSAISLLVTRADGQYYYKDIITSRQSQEQWKTLRDNKVRKVTLQSLERDGQPTPGFVCSQTCSADYKKLTTYTTSASIPPSTLIAFYDQTGKLVKTTDSSDSYVSTTLYEYNAAGCVAAVRNVAVETDNHLRSTEDHLWQYEGTVAVAMNKIRNGSDSTLVVFKSENGNATEEQATHRKEKLPAVYYYYDSARMLTDIVKYNVKAQRLLPDYMFSYTNGRTAQMIVVPAGTGDYQVWQYEYDEKNLKRRDVCRNRRKETVAIVTYSYSFQ